MRARVLFLFLTLVALCHALRAADPVRVQLKWLHQFQFAGYYAAIEKGYYRAAGLDVQLIEGAPGVDPAKVVLAGGAEFGVGTPELLLARAAGAPVVVLGVIFQHSPYVLLALDGGDIHSVTDLTGRRVMIEPQAAELYAYFQRERIPPGSLRILPHTFSTDDLLSKKTDAMSAYVTDEPFALEKSATRYLEFSPRAGGVDFYGDCFFTVEREIKDHPQRVKAFREATLLGWDYALKHPEEIIDLIVGKYHSQKSRDALRFEARQMLDLIHPEIIPVGYMYPGRWQHIMQTYMDLGMLKQPIPLDGFLYEPNPRANLAPLYWTTGIALCLAAATFGILLPIWRLNVRLKREISDHVETAELLKAARDVAVQADQAKMEFIAHVSHDLRTPLSSILMQAEMMERPERDAARKEELGIIREAGEQLLALVNDLLDMNRLESGHIELADQPFALAQAVSPVVDVLGVAARRKGLTLMQTVDPGLPRLHGDVERLRQILFNLVGNAVKFTDSGRVVVRASRTPAGWLRLEVADTGPGIPEEELSAVFDPFVRARTRTTRAKEGTGLGLAIVKRLAEAMGGRVSVQSAPGQGSTFSVEVPLLEKA